MKKNCDYSVCEGCYSVFNKFLDSLADSFAQKPIPQSQSDKKLIMKSNESLLDDQKGSFNILTKFFKRMSLEIQQKQYDNVTDYLDIVLNRDLDTLDKKFRKMKHLLERGSLLSSINFSKNTDDSRRNTKDLEDNENQMKIQSLIQNLDHEDELNEEEPYSNTLSYVDSQKLMELSGNNKYTINFKGDTKISSSLLNGSGFKKNGNSRMNNKK